MNVGLIAAFGNVWNRLGRVLHLIEKGKGSNELVEKKRGKRWVALDEQPFATPAAFAAAAAAEAAAAAAATAASNTSAHVEEAEEIVDLLDDDDDDDEMFL
jgi:hypothetical protein